ncbi:MAG TPA: hypothetical protein VH498_04345 [Candidatus Dormibacteraeota bacterium]|nr:hypothetical protein [Candidatus Dormibacteraeota bacterium]
MPIHRFVAAAAGAAVFAGAVWLGWADTARSLDLLTGMVVTQASAFALVATVCWMAAAVLTSVIITRLLGSTGGARRWMGPAPLALLAGATLLGLGVAHHSTGYSVCCANADTARQAEQHVR